MSTVLKYAQAISEQVKQQRALGLHTDGTAINEAEDGWKVRTASGDREVVFHASHPTEGKRSVGVHPYLKSGEKIADSVKKQLTSNDIPEKHPLHKKIVAHMVKKYG